MGLLDGPMRAVASKLIDVLGTSLVTFTRVSRAYNPSTDTDTETSTTAAMKITPPAPYSEHKVDGTTILATDLVAYVDALAVEAAAFDVELGTNINLSLVLGSDQFQVVSTKRVYSGDLSALYELQLRR